jgi:hypothetical protein
MAQLLSAAIHDTALMMEKRSQLRRFDSVQNAPVNIIIATTTNNTTAARAKKIRNRRLHSI